MVRRLTQAPISTLIISPHPHPSLSHIPKAAVGRLPVHRHLAQGHVLRERQRPRRHLPVRTHASSTKKNAFLSLCSPSPSCLSHSLFSLSAAFFLSPSLLVPLSNPPPHHPPPPTHPLYLTHHHHHHYTNTHQNQRPCLQRLAHPHARPRPIRRAAPGRRRRAGGGGGGRRRRHGGGWWDAAAAGGGGGGWDAVVRGVFVVVAGKHV